VLASQSEAALDRSETFLRNQDPKRTSMKVVQLAWLTGGSFCSPAVPPGLAKTNARRQLVRGGGPVVGCQEQAQ
jgi:hypothetical protein